MPELTDAQLDELMAAIGLVPPQPRRGTQRKPIAHGTYKGAKQHRYRQETPCPECRQAELDYWSSRRHNRTGYLTEDEWQACRNARKETP